jgi:hypothetical protein
MSCAIRPPVQASVVDERARYSRPPCSRRAAVTTGRNSLGLAPHIYYCGGLASRGARRASNYCRQSGWGDFSPAQVCFFVNSNCFPATETACGKLAGCRTRRGPLCCLLSRKRAAPIHHRCARRGAATRSFTSRTMPIAPLPDAIVAGLIGNAVGSPARSSLVGAIGTPVGSPAALGAVRRRAESNDHDRSQQDTTHRHLRGS